MHRPRSGASLPVHLAAATPLRISAEGMATALVLAVAARTGHAATAGFLQTAMTLPYVLSGPVAGHLLDRVARPGRVAVAMAAGYVAAAALLLALAGAAPLAVAAVAAVAVGLTEPVVVALSGLLPRFVPAPLLPRAYGLEAASYDVASIAGPGLAAVVASLYGGAHAGAAMVVAAALGLAALPFVRVPGPGPAGGPAARPGLGEVVTGGLAVLARLPVLRAFTVATTLAWLGFGGVAVSSVLLAERFGAPASGGGQLLVAFSAGALAGSLACSRWLTVRAALPVLFAGLAGFGGALALLPAMPSLGWALAVFAVAGAAEGPVFAATLMLRQREAPAERLGQVNTTAGSLKIGASALGAALTGLTADTIGPGGLFLAIAGFQFAGAGIGLALLRRARRGETLAAMDLV
ncbi:MFS transporter [Actinomadura parmotrematis]|uniref:MFS transporter n=1 Tax=Actinomadura parmotrematis TaxID=2864039 RepID=A0ABS7FN05_9ACTN|nr:MFS transporter [Actinomadura parmotrematis]MBW8481768.1 MFS transporter [Actinomadura parmotrematis]